MTDELEEVVKVLYDYTYSDDTGQIAIKAGDIYRLIEKTNGEWWQVYDPSDADGESFFVPAQYVKIVSEKSPWKALSDLDKLLTFGEDTRRSPTPDYINVEDDNVLYSSARNFSQHNAALSLQAGDVGKDTDYINAPQLSGNQGDDADYVNLDQFRDAAGIPAIVSGPKSQPPHVSQELIQGSIPPPLPEQGTFVRVLVKDLPWDIYKEHTAGRLYYVNRETGERMWKPPRKDKPSSEQTQASPTNVPTQVPTLVSPTRSEEGEWLGIPSEYEQVQDNGNMYFIHKGTQEKWKILVDKVGRRYFHKVGTSDTQWTLPASPAATPDKEVELLPTEQPIQHRDANWEVQGHRLSTFGQSVRAVKAMSMYGQLETTGVNSRASTLPANFTVARPAPVAHDLTRSPSLHRPAQLLISNSTGSLQVHEESLEGYLNKAKIAEVGKKKVKKNWSQTYVVLQGSNLVFYKDQKAAAQKPGSPHGRTEGVISLQGAHVDFNPPKEYTSKKNTILLSVSSGSQFLFQHDSEKTIREWFTRMKIVANDVSPVTESSPRDFDVKDEKKGVARTVSTDDSATGLSAERNKNMVGIKAKLLNLISRRPTQEDLYKRGIIRDAVFGSKLHELCDREKVHVPKFVHRCIAAVESKGLKHDGLYRISGNMAEIQRLRCAVDKDDTYDLYDAQWDVHVLTGALKLFFRELKEPVVPFHMYNKFLDAIKKETRKDKLQAVKSAVLDLPRCNYHTLKELFQHLRKVVELSHENRMQPQNVAIVFGPTLLWQQEDAGSLAVNTVFQSRIVEFMLLEYSDLFK